VDRKSDLSGNASAADEYSRVYESEAMMVEYKKSSKSFYLSSLSKSFLPSKEGRG
jgi:hypothetical protein